MEVSKAKLFCNSLKLCAYICPRVFQNVHFTNFNFSRYCSDNSSGKGDFHAVVSNVHDLKQNMQPVPKKYRKLSVIDEKDREYVEILKEGKNKYYPYKDAYDKVSSVLQEGFKELGSRTVKTITGVNLNHSQQQQPFYLRHSDIVLVGCNAISLSIACAMKQKCPDTPTILIIDKDDKFPHASTNIGQSMLLQQLFTDEEEIIMSKYAAEFFSSFPRLTAINHEKRFKLPYEPLGSLLLVDQSNAEIMIKKIETLKKHNINPRVLDTKALKKKFPWLKLDNVLFGSLGMTKEGMYDPWSFLIGLKCKAINAGVQFMTAEVLDFGIDKYQIPRRVICKLPNGGYHAVEFSYCVLTAGIESLNLVEVLNSSNLGPVIIKLPLEERMRYEYCFYSPKGPGLDTPVVIDADGTYFRREGLCNYYVAGVPNISHSADEDLGPYYVFDKKVKPFLEKRVPQFDQIDLIKGWVDSYDFCISNEVGILGPHPNDFKIIFALGFSHLGLQYAPAIGRAIMEYIVYDKYVEIDLSRYHIENLWMKQHLEAEKKKLEMVESQKRLAISD